MKQTLKSSFLWAGLRLFCPSRPSVLSCFAGLCGKSWQVFSHLYGCQSSQTKLFETRQTSVWTEVLWTFWDVCRRFCSCVCMWDVLMWLSFTVSDQDQDLLCNQKWQILIRLKSLSALRFGKKNLRHKRGEGLGVGGRGGCFLFFYLILYFWSNWLHHIKIGSHYSLRSLLVVD